MSTEKGVPAYGTPSTHSYPVTVICFKMYFLAFLPVISFPPVSSIIRSPSITLKVSPSFSPVSFMLSPLFCHVNLPKVVNTLSGSFLPGRSSPLCSFPHNPTLSQHQYRDNLRKGLSLRIFLHSLRNYERYARQKDLLRRLCAVQMRLALSDYLFLYCGFHRKQIQKQMRIIINFSYLDNFND